MSKKETTTKKSGPITVCISCLVAYTDHESGECDDCLLDSMIEAEVFFARALISKTENVETNK